MLWMPLQLDSGSFLKCSQHVAPGGPELPPAKQAVWSPKPRDWLPSDGEQKAPLLSRVPLPCLCVGWTSSLQLPGPSPQSSESLQVPVEHSNGFSSFTTAPLGLILNLELFPIHEFSSPPVRGHLRLGVWGPRCGQNRPTGLEPSRGADVCAGALLGDPLPCGYLCFHPPELYLLQLAGPASPPVPGFSPSPAGLPDPGVHPHLCGVHICPPSLTRAGDLSGSCRCGFCEVPLLGLQLWGTPFPKCL